MAVLRKIWWKLYPSDDKHRWMPLIWLPFMVWFFVDPIWKHGGPLLWIGNTLCGLFFIWLYLYSFSRPEPRKLFAIAAMIVMATIAIPFNSGGSRPAGLRYRCRRLQPEALARAGPHRA